MWKVQMYDKLLRSDLVMFFVSLVAGSGFVVLLATSKVSRDIILQLASAKKVNLVVLLAVFLSIILIIGFIRWSGKLRLVAPAVAAVFFAAAMAQALCFSEFNALNQSTVGFGRDLSLYVMAKSNSHEATAKKFPPLIELSKKVGGKVLKIDRPTFEKYRYYVYLITGNEAEIVSEEEVAAQSEAIVVEEYTRENNFYYFLPDYFRSNGIYFVPSEKNQYYFIEKSSTVFIK